MRMVYTDEDPAQREFAERAAKRFADDENIKTYTDSDIECGCFFALRWGSGEDCVVVFKVDETNTPTNYMNLVRKFNSGGGDNG